MTLVWEPPPLPLAPASKANSRRLVTYGGRKRLIKSETAQAFMDTAKVFWGAHRPTPAFSENAKLKLTYTVRYADNRRDFIGSAEMIGDALQMAGVLSNDRQIREFGPSKAMDETGEPMLWVRLESIGVLLWKRKVGR